MRKSFVMYAEWADQIINMPSDLAGEYIQAIAHYAIYGEDVKPDNQLLNAMLVPVYKRIDEDLEKYQAKVDRVKSISKRNRNDIETKSKRNRNDIEGVNVNVNDNDNDKKIKKKGFHNFHERTIDFGALKAGGGDV